MNDSINYISTAGTYTIQVAVSNVSCADTSTSINITVINFTAQIDTVGSSVNECGSVSLYSPSTGAGMTYEWLNPTLTTGVTNDTFAITVSGTYRVYVDSGFGCTDTSTAIAVNIIPSLKVDVKVFLEGPYVSGTNLMTTGLLGTGDLNAQYAFGGAGGGYLPFLNMNVGQPIPANAVDVIQLELRTGGNPQNIEDTLYAWLINDGSIRDFATGLQNYAEECTTTPSGNYHVAVKHRNHLTIMSDTAILINDNPPTLNDFTTTDSTIYGAITNVMGIKGAADGNLMMIGGNAFSSWQEINADDLNLATQDNNGLVSGYILTDFELSGVVNGVDWTKTSLNNDELYFSTTPNP